MKELFPGVYTYENKLWTRNLVPGVSVYGEKLVKYGGTEYREWDPFRSKLAGAIKKQLKYFPFKKGSIVLYLGASTGTTISHLSDIITDGEIYGVELSKRMIMELAKLAEQRENIIPILADARVPEEYKDVGTVDILYQDVAQPDQIDIFLKNAKLFKPKWGMLALKTQSIDISKEPEEILESSLQPLREKFDILQTIKLDPYDKLHYFLVLKDKEGKTI